jgi:deoxyribodipyrimidine photo-lyase
MPMPQFEPTAAAAWQCLERVRPDDYARTRNALDGAVTHLSPYLTHGFLSLAEVYTAVNARHALHAQHKLVFELGWRAYYRHMWAHLGDSIDQALHAGVLPESSYQAAMPQDVQEARTGIPAIDLAVRALYETGYVHNHARMWLASYLVHLRKVHWRAGAAWMYGYLLDGDWASNTLSWQWVAGTGSAKPYLFNADNVAKYAPTPWHSHGTGIDRSYDAMNDIAHNPNPIDTGHDTAQASKGTGPPALFESPLLLGTISGAPHGWQAPDASNTQALSGRHVWLHHPWSLGPRPTHLPDDTLHVGVGFDTCHTGRPWSLRRWQFVSHGLRAQVDAALPLYWGNAAQMAHALRAAKSVHWLPEPHANPALHALQTRLHQADPQRPAGPLPERCLFETVPSYCPSFSAWWKKTRIAEPGAPRNLAEPWRNIA